MIREAFIYRSSQDGRRHICIDRLNSTEIFIFLKEDPAQIKKFRHIIDIILRGFKNTDLYDKEDIDSKSCKVTAMKMFKGGQNTRIYCKEYTDKNGTFYVIASELLEKKKDNKVKGVSKNIIQKVSSYEYKIITNETDTNQRMG